MSSPINKPVKSAPAEDQALSHSVEGTLGNSDLPVDDHDSHAAPKGCKQSKAYFEELCKFIQMTLGDAALSKFEVIIDDPQLVSQKLKSAMSGVREYRKSQGDAYYFNWTLKIENDFQQPFYPTHEAMGSLDLHLDQPKQQLAANLRRAFSGIVAGNVKEEGHL